MSGNKKSSLTGYLPDILMAVATPVLAFFVVKSLLARLDPEASQKEEARKKAQAAAQRLDTALARKAAAEYDSDSSDSDYDGTGGRRRRRRRRSGARPEQLQLTPYEQTIAMEVVNPEDIPVSFDDIGGLDNIIEDLRESVIYPLTHPSLSMTSNLLAAPSGVLLYGPPGCGKTMMAKALAHESGACFINLHISTLTEKWYGDSNKLVSAVFSLARKLQPAIVFIDEIDAVLGTRRTSDHEASGMVKAEFMTHWDGLSSSHSGTTTPQRILILGATNRMQDIDDAILRRMPKKFPVGLPNAFQRRNIFTLILRGTKIDHDNFDLDYVVRMSAGMSGSDIKEACRDAAMGPVKEYIRMKRAAEAREGGSGRKKRRGGEMKAEEVRGVRTSDFKFQGLGPETSIEYARERMAQLDESSSPASLDEESIDEGEERFREAEEVR